MFDLSKCQLMAIASSLNMCWKDFYNIQFIEFPLVCFLRLLDGSNEAQKKTHYWHYFDESELFNDNFDLLRKSWTTTAVRNCFNFHSNVHSKAVFSARNFELKMQIMFIFSLVIRTKFFFYLFYFTSFDCCCCCCCKCCGYIYMSENRYSMCVFTAC